MDEPGAVAVVAVDRGDDVHDRAAHAADAEGGGGEGDDEWAAGGQGLGDGLFVEGGDRLEHGGDGIEGGSVIRGGGLACWGRFADGDGGRFGAHFERQGRVFEGAGGGHGDFHARTPDAGFVELRRIDDVDAGGLLVEVIFAVVVEVAGLGDGLAVDGGRRGTQDRLAGVELVEVDLDGGSGNENVVVAEEPEGEAVLADDVFGAGGEDDDFGGSRLDYGGGVSSGADARAATSEHERADGQSGQQAAPAEGGGEG